MKLRLRPVLASVVFTLAAHAAEPGPSWPDYLAPDAIDYAQVIPPAVDESSFDAAADHELALQFAAHRTADQAVLAKRYERLTVFQLLAPVLGDWATAKNLPVTARIFEQIRQAGRPAIEAAKSAWNRRRPFERFPDAISPAVERPHNTSYPSGHAADSMIYVVVLTELFPEHAAAWREQAALVRWSRLVGGAHYPRDVVAGKILGEVIGREMLKSPQLRADLELVRAELRAVRFAPPHLQSSLLGPYDNLSKKLGANLRVRRTAQPGNETTVKAASTSRL